MISKKQFKQDRKKEKEIGTGQEEKRGESGKGTRKCGQDVLIVPYVCVLFVCLASECKQKYEQNELAVFMCELTLRSKGSDAFSSPCFFTAAYTQLCID